MLVHIRYMVLVGSEDRSVGEVRVMVQELIAVQALVTVKQLVGQVYGVTYSANGVLKVMFVEAESFRAAFEEVGKRADFDARSTVLAIVFTRINPRNSQIFEATTGQMISGYEEGELM